MDSRIASPPVATHTTYMTKALDLRLTIISLVFVAVLGAAVAVQYVAQLIADGLTDSKGMRVAEVTSCAIAGDGAHFTGCSSLL